MSPRIPRTAREFKTGAVKGALPCASHVTVRGAPMHRYTASHNACSNVPVATAISVFVFHKMADGFCEEGRGTCITNEKLESTSSELSCETEYVALDVKPIMGDRNEPFFTHKDSEQLCTKFASSAVHGKEEVCVKEEKPQRSLSVPLESLCEENEDNCRKKRCADRYDSSESSDRCVRKHGCSTQRKMQDALAFSPSPQTLLSFPLSIASPLSHVGVAPGR